MILYSITDKKSFESVKKTWFPEVREFSQAPIILVGCKLGLCLTNPLLRQIKKEEAAEFSASNKMTFFEVDSHLDISV